MDRVLETELKVDTLSKKYFDEIYLSKKTEFHGHPLYTGKDQFKDFDENTRMGIYKDLLSIVHSDYILKIDICVDSSHPRASGISDYNKFAFLFLVEKANELMKSESCFGLLIGDHDNKELVDLSVSRLDSYKKEGTPNLAQGISNLVDTVYYAKSHHSRMIQLADIYVHSLHCCQKTVKNQFDNEIKQFCTGQSFPDKYRHWPS